MAQAVLCGIGAYSAGLLAVNLGFSPLLSIIGAIVSPSSPLASWPC